VVIYATAVAVVSGMEVVLFRHAHRGGLFTNPLPDDVYRWGTIASLSPVLFFLASIPVAFVSTTAAVLCWLGVIPFAAIVDRWKPERADELLGGLRRGRG
jgi:hypothetical protein